MQEKIKLELHRKKKERDKKIIAKLVDKQKKKSMNMQCNLLYIDNRVQLTCKVIQLSYRV